MKPLNIVVSILLFAIHCFSASLTWTAVNGAVMEDYSSPPMVTPTVTLNTTGGPNWRFGTQPVGKTFRIIARLYCAMNGIPASRSCGMVMFDGIKVEAFDLLWDNTDQTPGLRVQTGVNVTSSTATVKGPTYNLVGTGATLQIADDGTSRSFYYWKNGTFVLFFSEPSHTFLTPTQIGFGGLEQGNQKGTFLSAMCMIWTNN